MDSISRLWELLPRVSKIWLSVRARVAGTSTSYSEEMEEISGILDDLESIKKISAWIKATLIDAEERAVRGEQRVRLWLTELHHLAYRASDLVGLYEYEVIAQEVSKCGPEMQKASDPSGLGKRNLEELYQVHASSPLTDPSFRHKFACDIRKFREELDEINGIKDALHFNKDDGERINTRDCDIIDHQPTGSAPIEGRVLGRASRIQALIELLLDDDIKKIDTDGKSIVPVIALVGMGGVGKTTLAQHVFNDIKVSNHYFSEGWVCVSDDFNVQSLTKRTDEALRAGYKSNEGYKEKHEDLQVGRNSNELSNLQNNLKKEAKKTKFLLVLDDVWNENYGLWDTFYSSLKHSVTGSKIVITTRSQIVAHTSAAMKCVHVDCLLENDAWTLFQTFAFGNLINYGPEYHILMDIGKKIARKCDGLPLAIKVLGRYLRFEKSLDTWNHVLTSDLWECHMWEEGKQILGPLILSYLHLPAHLKPCFVISSAFPKSHDIGKKELINLWMAHDLVNDYNEDTGMRYLQTLVYRSFFIERGDYKVTMHDLIYDLAQFLSKDIVLHGHHKDRDLCIFHDVQHAFFHCSLNDTVFRLCHNRNHTGSLRTLSMRTSWIHNLAPVEKIAFPCQEHVRLEGLRILIFHAPAMRYGGILPNCLNTLRNLRELYLCKFEWKTLEIDAICSLYNLQKLTLYSYQKGKALLWLPNSIGNLKHLNSLSLSSVSYVPDSIGCLTKLRKLQLYGAWISHLPISISKLVNLKELDLNQSKIKALPNSMGSLTALQVLNLCSCRNLNRLPRDLVNLTNLISIDLEGSYEGYFPVGFGRLKTLCSLPFFWVPPKEAIKEYAGIDELRDLLDISGCLWISHLKNVANQAVAGQARLMNKKCVFHLMLHWGPFTKEEKKTTVETTTMTTDEQVLEGLAAHVNIRSVSINGWRGWRLASWMGNRSFVNILTIRLEELPNCTSLWPLHQLPSLKDLSCSDMPSLVNLVPSSIQHSDGDIDNTCFPTLERLKLQQCLQLRTVTDIYEHNPAFKRLGMDIDYSSSWAVRFVRRKG